MWKIESEVTFEVTTENALRLQRLFEIYSSGIEIGTRFYRSTPFKEKLVLHIYVATANPNIRHRIILDLLDPYSGVVHSFKQWNVRRGRLVKLERNQQSTLEDSLGFLNATSILASLAKRKTIWKFRGNDAILKVALDCIVAINTGTGNLMGDPFFHIEFEEKRGRSLNRLLESQFWASEVAPYVQKTTVSKLAIVGKHSLQNDVLRSHTIEDLIEYLYNVRRNLETCVQSNLTIF